MKWLQGQEGFTRLASFVCDSDQDEPFSDQDLEVIQAIEASFLPKPNKRPFNPTNDHHDATADTTSPDSPRRSWSRRRRLPRSLVALQHPTAFSLSPCQGHSRMRLPVMKFCGQIMYSRTFDDVEKAATKLLKILEEKKREMVQIALGFDIE